MSRPIKIVRVTHGYNVFVHDVPVVPDGKGVTIDRGRIGLKIPRGYKPPPLEARPILIGKSSDAAGVAHQIGRYLLGLGDFVPTYTDLVGVNDHEKWWHGALR